MYTNGIIIQNAVNNQYKGIDGSGFSYLTGCNWYLNMDSELSEEFESYYDEHIGMTYCNMPEKSWIAACTDMDYIKRYIEESQKRKIQFRILLCESDIPNPIFHYEGTTPIFLGYDYAYATGDNYSAVYNEIPFVFSQFRLNKNGLFESENEIHKYIHERQKFIRTHEPYTLESGDFVVLKLSEIKSDFLI